MGFTGKPTLSQQLSAASRANSQPTIDAETNKEKKAELIKEAEKKAELAGNVQNTVNEQDKHQIKGLRKITQKTSNLTFFPNDIMSKNFNNKRLYISIYESKSVSDIAEQLTNTAIKAKDKVVKAFETGEGASGTTKNVAGAINSILNEIADFKGVEKFIIALPLPNELSDSQAHNFSTETGFSAAAGELVESANPLFSINKAVGRIAASLSVPRVLANPGYFQNYTGSEPRTFAFSFKMIPNSKVEADTIIKVITMLKKYSSPTLNAGTIMLAPHFFHFWFSNNTLQQLTGIRPCIVSDVQTNYSGSGILETTMDGMPKQIDLSITIKELRTITEDKWSHK